MSSIREGIVRLISWLGLVCVVAVAVVAGDLPASFEEARTMAEAQEHAPSTREYFVRILLPTYAEKYQPVLKSCFARVAKPSSESFAFVVAIGADGRVVHLYNDRETNVFQCMRGTLERDMFPTPPEAPYFLNIDMQFPDGEVSQRPQKAIAPPLVVEPQRYSYTFGVPQGWDHSFEQAQEIGARLLLFPRGGSFDESNSVIYVNEVCHANCIGLTKRSIERTIEDSREESPKLRVTINSPIKLRAGGEAPVRVLLGARDPRQAKEALAFIEHEDVIVLVVLTTKDPSHWAEDYAAFEQVVSGHRFFTCDSPELAVPCR